MTKEQLLNEIITAIHPPLPAQEALAMLEWLRNELDAYIVALQEDIALLQEGVS